MHKWKLAFQKVQYELNRNWNLFTCLAHHYRPWTRWDRNLITWRTIGNQRDNCSTASCHETQSHCRVRKSGLSWCQTQVMTQTCYLIWDLHLPVQFRDSHVRNNLSEYKCWNSQSSHPQMSQCSRVVAMKKLVKKGRKKLRFHVFLISCSYTSLISFSSFLMFLVKSIERLWTFFNATKFPR